MIESIDSPYIHAADDDHFDSLVLENSQKGPVLVNFWSKKAGPCLRQYPILDKLVHHYKGRFLLVNVDTLNVHRSTQTYGISSVPTLKLFHHGQLVASRHGYQDETSLQQLLDQYVVRDSDQQLAQAMHAYAQGQQQQAYDLLAKAIIDDPINPRLPLTLCKLLKHEQRFEEALQLLTVLPADISAMADIKQLHAQLYFLRIAGNSHNDPQGLEQLIQQTQTQPDDLALKQTLAAAYMLQDQPQAALDELLKIMDVQLDYDEGYARKAMLNIFELLGDEDDLTKQYRPHVRRYAH